MQEIESNILDTLKLDTALRLAKQKSKEGSCAEARTIYKDILYKFPKNKKAIEGIKADWTAIKVYGAIELKHKTFRFKSHAN